MRTRKTSVVVTRIILAVLVISASFMFFKPSPNINNEPTKLVLNQKTEVVKKPDTPEVATAPKAEILKKAKQNPEKNAKIISILEKKEAKPIKKSGILSSLLGSHNATFYTFEDGKNQKDVYFLNNPVTAPKSQKATLSGLETDNEIIVESESQFALEGEVKPWTTGTKNVLIIFHNFSDLNFLTNASNVDDEIAKSAIESNVTNASNSSTNFYTEASYGNIATNFTVTNQLSTSYSAGSGCSISDIATTAEAAAVAAGYNPGAYHHVVYLFPFMSSCTFGGGVWAGLGEWPGNQIWLNGYYDAKTVAHELGHNLGVGHANRLECGTKTVDTYSSCSEVEYGDWYDTMGYGYDHFNAIYKEYFGWLSGKVQTVSSSGGYTIYPLEDTNNNTKAIKIRKPDTNEFYYFEYRQALGFDSNLTEGITGGALGHIGNSNGSDTMLIDFTPNMQENDLDYMALTDGMTFTDSANGVAVTAAVGEGSVTLNVTLTPIPTYTAVHRFYNKKNGTHFYTASEAEKNNVIARYPLTYRYEGIAYYLNTSSQANNIPLYRFYNTRGTHFYTASEAEKNNVIARYSRTYRFEGVAYYVSNTTGNPVYRFYNTRGTHFYTASEAEKNNVIAKYSTTYRFEGIGYKFN